jgi:hypothetical protein
LYSVMLIVLYMMLIQSFKLLYLKILDWEKVFWC